MRYQQAHAALAACFDQAPDRLDVPGTDVVVYNCSFESASWRILPGADAYRCRTHDRVFEGSPAGGLGGRVPGPLDVADVAVTENRRFRYSVFADARQARARGIIVLFHGLNERDWGKYLSWAQRLVELTGKAVVLFPIAFHMNRAPAAWGDPRQMQRVARDRHVASPTLANATFANAAISTRLQAIPQRFVWSGLQTFYDIAQLVDEIRAGRHPHVAEDASVDFFGYSIGAFLSEILLMTDPEGRFARTRLFIFCGGATVDRMYPNSRYILDSDATIALYSFFQARFENELRADERMAHYMSTDHAEGQYFTAMINYQQSKEQRERRLGELSDRLAALALRRDDVIPANEVLNTLQGDFRDIPVRVEVADFEHPYNHVTPFPLRAPEDAVQRSFDRVFETAAAHLG